MFEDSEKIISLLRTLIYMCQDSDFGDRIGKQAVWNGRSQQKSPCVIDIPVENTLFTPQSDHWTRMQYRTYK